MDLNFPFKVFHKFIGYESYCRDCDTCEINDGNIYAAVLSKYKFGDFICIHCSKESDKLVFAIVDEITSCIKCGLNYDELDKNYNSVKHILCTSFRVEWNLSIPNIRSSDAKYYSDFYSDWCPDYKLDSLINIGIKYLNEIVIDYVRKMIFGYDVTIYVLNSHHNTLYKYLVINRKRYRNVKKNILQELLPDGKVQYLPY